MSFFVARRGLGPTENPLERGTQRDPVSATLHLVQQRPRPARMRVRSRGQGLVVHEEGWVRLQTFNFSNIARCFELVTIACVWQF